MNMYLPVYQWNSERSFTKKTQMRIQHEYVFASVSVEWWEKFYKEDSNEDSTGICMSIVSVEWWGKFYKEDSNQDSTWICICLWISGIVREVLQRRLKWGFYMNMYFPVHQWNVQKMMQSELQTGPFHLNKTIASQL